MKNRLFTIIALIILGGIMNGCEDFLALAPVSQANVENFYKTADDIDKAVIAAYQMQKTTYGVMLELRSDDSGVNNTTDHVDNFTDDSGYGVYSALWESAYKAIYRCNIGLEKAPGVSMDENLKNRYMAELRFNRAITYFELVRYFGGVPLVLETYQTLTPDVVNVPRNTVDEVYNQIIADLQFAAENLEIAYTSDSDIGRATKGAAEAYLGKVYLTLGNPSAATPLFRNVMTYGYELLPNYIDVFGAQNHNNKEIVFEYQYKSTTDPNGIIWSLRSNNISEMPGYGFAPGTQDLYNAYEPGDPRRDLTLAIDDIDLYYSVKYVDPNANPISDANNNIPRMRYAEVLLLLAESLGETNESYDLINQVRTRVGLPDIDASTPGTFKDKLLHERRVELAYENHRWHDLLRFGVAIEVMNTYFDTYKNGLVQINEDKLLFPIPHSAILTDPNLEQNPSYPR